MCAVSQEYRANSIECQRIASLQLSSGQWNSCHTPQKSSHIFRDMSPEGALIISTAGPRNIVA